MDRIEKLLKDIKDDNSIWKDRRGDPIKFSNKVLNDVGDIFEKHGFGVTRIYLTNQKFRSQEKNQAESLLKVLKIMETCLEIINNRAIGRYIIKTLDNIKKMEV